MRYFRGHFQIALLALLTLVGGEFLHFAGHGRAAEWISLTERAVLTADPASASHETGDFVCGEFCPVCAGMLELDMPGAAIAVPGDICAETCPVPPDMPHLAILPGAAPARAPPAQV